MTPKPKPSTRPVLPARETAPAASGGHNNHSRLLFLFAAILLAVGAVTVVRSPPVRARLARARAGTRRRRPETREVIAELVQTPPIPTRTAASFSAPTVAHEPAVTKPEVETERTSEPEELLLPAAAAVASDGAATEVLPAAAEKVEEPTEEFCQISVWRGYAKSRFFARLEIGDNGYDEVAVAESPTFRPKGNGIPERTTAAEAAHAALLGFLLADGWEVEGKAGPWYADRLRRSVADREPAAPALPAP